MGMELDVRHPLALARGEGETITDRDARFVAILVDRPELTQVSGAAFLLPGGPLRRLAQLIQLGVELLDPSPQPLGDPGSLAGLEEVAAGRERLLAVEAEPVEHAVQALPELFPPLVQRRLGP